MVLKTGPCDPKTHWKQTVLVVPGNMADGDVEEDWVVTHHVPVREQCQAVQRGAGGAGPWYCGHLKLLHFYENKFLSSILRDP